MSNRTLIELNHDFCPKEEDRAKWANQLVQYMTSGDEKYLPDGVTFYGMRHHSDPNPMVKLRNLEKAFEDAHEELTKVGIPKADFVECNDPTCQSKLVHRMRLLLARNEQDNIKLTSLKYKITQIQKELNELNGQLVSLEITNRVHSLVRTLEAIVS